MDKSIIFSFFLPITIMYLLMIIRIFERRMKSRLSENEYEERYFLKSSFLILGYRDFFLAALILDLVQLTKVLTSLSSGFNNTVETAIAISAFFIHFTLFILLIPRINEPKSKIRGKMGYVFDLYIGIIVLFTNALTLSSIFLSVY